MRRLACILTLACGASDGPLMAYELAGWQGCSNDARQICLTIGEPTSAPYLTYTWNTPGCVETGRLTGGLEFSPNTDSPLCLAPEPSLYSAEGDWTGNGVRLSVDQSPADDRANGRDDRLVLDLSYQP